MQYFSGADQKILLWKSSMTYSAGERQNTAAEPMALQVCHCLTVLLLIILIFYFSKQRNFMRSTPIDVCSLTQSGPQLQTLLNMIIASEERRKQKYYNQIC